MLRAYLQLFRLPNVFTALADVAMGYLVTQPVGRETWWIGGLLLLASGLLYTSGMVLNDVVDAEVDARERPFRPIPSGRISRRFARWLGFELMILGLASAGVAGWLAGEAMTLIVASALAGAILLYDLVLKRTGGAPLGMGLCRGLNVLLGMSTLVGPWQLHHYLIAAGIGIYIVGVTWFSRQEAELSAVRSLTGATLVMAAGIAVLALFPRMSGIPVQSFPGVVRLGTNWDLLWGLLGGSILFRALGALGDPSSTRVQIAVKHAILSLIVLDAAIVLAFRELPYAMAVLALMIPARVLGRWIYST